MRLSKITTRTGDDGTTSVDELNSQLGVLLAETLPEEVRGELLRIQNDLFDLGGTLAVPGAPFAAAKLARLDEAIAHYNTGLPPLKEFILPGGTRAAALCHVTRSVARRTERDYLQLLQNETIPAEGLRYLNRLSDLLFVLCRVLNRAADCPEALWSRD